MDFFELLIKLHERILLAFERIKRVCEQNSIYYFLIRETASDIVRYKDFISCDNDVDVRNKIVKHCEKGWLPLMFKSQHIKLEPHIHEDFKNRKHMFSKKIAGVLIKFQKNFMKFLLIKHQNEYPTSEISF